MLREKCNSDCIMLVCVQFSIPNWAWLKKKKNKKTLNDLMLKINDTKSKIPEAVSKSFCYNVSVVIDVLL